MYNIVKRIFMYITNLLFWKIK